MTISSILNYIDWGHLRLPESARPYVWSTRQVLKLFNSLYCDYPVGTLIVWDTDYTTTATRGAKPSPTGPVELLIDGQQRITSIYAVARGRMPYFAEGDVDAFPRVHFNVETEAFQFYTATMQADPCWIDLSALFTRGHYDFEALTALATHSPEGLATASRYLLRLNRLRAILDTDIYVEYLPRDTAIIDIGEIYHLANARGSRE